MVVTLEAVLAVVAGEVRFGGDAVADRDLPLHEGFVGAVDDGACDLVPEHHGESPHVVRALVETEVGSSDRRCFHLEDRSLRRFVGDCELLVFETTRF